jgi:hypothetical protein
MFIQQTPIPNLQVVRKLSRVLIWGRCDCEYTSKYHNLVEFDLETATSSFKKRYLILPRSRAAFLCILNLEFDGWYWEHLLLSLGWKHLEIYSLSGLSSVVFPLLLFFWVWFPWDAGQGMNDVLRIIGRNLVSLEGSGCDHRWIVNRNSSVVKSAVYNTRDHCEIRRILFLSLNGELKKGWRSWQTWKAGRDLYGFGVGWRMSEVKGRV